MNLRIWALAFASMLAIAPRCHGASQVVLTEAPTRDTLSNGLRVVIVSNSIAPAATVELSVLAGGDESPRQFPGLAHAQEHMAFRGCSGMTTDQTSAIYSYLGGENNAETDQNVTHYFLTVPSADLDVALRVQAACVHHIEDSSEEWAEERGAIEEEVDQDISDPWYRLEQRVNEDMFSGTPYAQDALGTKDSFETLSSEDLKDFYRKWYAPNNMILVIAGSVDPASTLAKVQELFGDVPAREVPTPPEIRLRPVRNETFHLSSDLPNCIDVIAYRFPGTGSRDYAAGLILADALSSQRAGLYRLQKTGKVAETDFETIESYPKAGVAFAEAEVSPDEMPDEAVQEVLRVLDHYAHHGVPPDLVDAAKRSELAHAKFERASISGIADTWSDALGAERRNSPDEDLDAIRRITAADVNRVARQYLNKSSRVVGVLIPTFENAPARQNAMAAEKHANHSERNATLPARSISLPSWAGSALAELKVPQTNNTDYDVTLKNGLRLIVRTDHSSPVVMIKGAVRQALPSRSFAFDTLAAQVLDELYDYGTRKMPAFAFQKALDEIGAEERGGYHFALDVQKENFSRGVELLADNELRPRLKSKDFLVAMQQVQRDLISRLRSPEARSSDALATALLPRGDPELREISPVAFKQLDLRMLRKFYAATIRPDLTTIVVVGDLSPEEARSVIEKWFGDWKATGPAPDTTLPPVPLNSPSSVEIADPGATDDTVTLAEELRLDRFDPDYLPLQLGNTILGGDFEGARLYHDLRQVSGYVYSVNLELDASERRAEYSLSFRSAPENTAKASALLRQDLEEMRTTEVSEDELDQAKAFLLRQITLSEASEEDVALGLLARAEAGLPLNEPVIEAQQYLGVTAAQIRAAFAEKVRPEGFVQIIRVPAHKSETP